jgi:branched-chain amino acid aminotransferase
MTQTAHGVEFKQQLSATPKSAEERAAILANPGFGNYFTDHTAIVDYSVDENGDGGARSTSAVGDAIAAAL